MAEGGKGVYGRVEGALINLAANREAKQIARGLGKSEVSPRDVNDIVYDTGLEEQEKTRLKAELVERRRLLGDNPTYLERIRWLARLAFGTEDPTDRLLDPDTGNNHELSPGTYQSYICRPGERVVTLGRGPAANLYVNENNRIFHGRELEITYNPNDTITYFFPRKSPNKPPQVHLTDAVGKRIPPATGYPQGETLLPKTVDGNFVGWQVTFKRDIVTADPTGRGRGVEVESDAGGEYKVTHQTTRVGQDMVLAQCRMTKRVL